MKTFKEYIKTTTPMVIKTVDQCSEYELILFHQMLRKSGLQKITMEQILNRGEHLGFYYDDTDLVAIGAIKKPDAAKYLFQEAGVPEKASHYKHEIGWSYVEPNYRNRGINAKLVKGLLDEIHNTPTFCTIRSENTASVASYQKFGFEMLGDPFYVSGALVILFVRG